jgi:hypothetical protein
MGSSTKTVGTCVKCKRRSGAKWKRFKGGSVHLVFWCDFCQKQVGMPIQKSRARLVYVRETYEHACARLTVENDSTWSLL